MNKPYTPTPGSKAKQLIDVLQRNPGAMRTKELEAFTGIPHENIPSLLATAVEHGLVTVCKIIQPGTRPGNEYRIGPGFNTNRPTLKPTKPTIIPVREHEGKVIDKPLPKPATPRPIYPASQAQPEVANNTGSDPQVATSLPAEVAVAAIKATPKPKAKVRELGPAAQTVSAGNDVGIQIDNLGVLTIATEETVIELEPLQVLVLGDFMSKSEGIWRR
jgi:hypothetical protein